MSRQLDLLQAHECLRPTLNTLIAGMIANANTHRHAPYQRSDRPDRPLPHFRKEPAESRHGSNPLKA